MMEAINEEEEDYEWEELVAIAHNHFAIVAMLMDDLTSGSRIDHRLLPRNKRRKFKHDEALHCINRDYLGPTPLFNGKQFELFFRISPARFQRLMEDVFGKGDPFYTTTTTIVGEPTSSLEARLLLPLKTLAYGVAPHCFTDYFQMSETFARQCCKKFEEVILEIYQEEYLRVPTQEDLQSISKLHKEVHGIEGMFGSLDCMHTFWKNCPYGWQGQYKGKEDHPSVVLEAISDYHLWFWHASYGYCGTINDRTILSLSPFMDSLVDGTFIEAEKGVVPYKINSEEFTKMFILVDGIHPRCSRFVKSMKYPGTPLEKCFVQWQEACRKDIERAFGVLQSKFQCMARPFLHHDLVSMSKRVGCCMILHNMCVSDRVMAGDVRARYKPSNHLDEYSVIVDDPDDLHQVQGPTPNAAPVVGLGDVEEEVMEYVFDRDIYRELLDEDEHARLHLAIMSQVHSYYK